jgi:hypothetical protein
LEAPGRIIAPVALQHQLAVLKRSQTHVTDIFKPKRYCNAASAGPFRVE